LFLIIDNISHTIAFRPFKCFNNIQVAYAFIVDGKIWQQTTNKIYRNKYTAIESKSIDCNYNINPLSTNDKSYIKFNIYSNCTNIEPSGGSHFEIFSLSMNEITNINDTLSSIHDQGILSNCYINDNLDNNYVVTCRTYTSSDSSTTCGIINGYIFYEHYDAVSDTLGNIYLSIYIHLKYLPSMNLSTYLPIRYE
jgi:hypothetical protein